ncbi:quaternary ammonium compound efflux SMR transporter SugE [Aureliella helgolandensis]|uniref:Guanidinium exporter n=1 Tax=Aureliella helgolandensis TaxID=2527968 RepID=A0A518G007_9BACT|nr:quaternary ammonium compound efflux SMR transporter SugE [Aureliella helgolandensis]QDV21880.1 Quaternary ammonium compound-resistance protein SugE [Aureliella helgolandensis]
MAWLILFLAGLFEIGWAIGLKYSQGFTQFWPSVFTIVSLTISFVLLGVAVRSLPLGTAYAVWTGIGAIGTVTLAIFLFGEAANSMRLLCVALIVTGIIGLKFSTAENAELDSPAEPDSAVIESH